MKAGGRLYIVGLPGKVGGAATKAAHLIKLLHREFDIAIVATDGYGLRDKDIGRTLEPYGVPRVSIKDIPYNTKGVALGICDKRFFVDGTAAFLKGRGLKVVWSNEMMWPFEAEGEAAKSRLVDRVLFVSEFQARAFAEMYSGVPSAITGNYVDPADFPFTERANQVFTIGRLSRADVDKYPSDFPVFYESLGLPEIRYRVMAWGPDLTKRFRWHSFGPEWELLPENKQPAVKFLHSLDVLVYPIGHRVKESWGRAVVEAMLTGCVPVVPKGHQFESFIRTGETGFLCEEFKEFRDCVQCLYKDYPLRRRIAIRASDFARQHLCDPSRHRSMWMEALTFSEGGT